MNQNEEKPVKYPRLITTNSNGKLSTSVIATKFVLNSQEIEYLEFFGNSKAVEHVCKDLRKANGRFTLADERVINFKKLSVKTQTISRGVVAAIAYNPDIFSKTPLSFLGRNKDEVYASFKRWLHFVQPLPFPRGYKEEINIEAQRWIMDAMIAQSLLVPLKTHGGMMGYSLATNVVPQDERMQKIILDCVKASGLLEIDRCIHHLKKSAPKIGESNVDLTKVFYTIENKRTNQSYYVIEYDQETKEVFCLVKENTSGKIIWEQVLFEKLFSDGDTYINKTEEFTDICISSDGTIKKAA